MVRRSLTLAAVVFATILACFTLLPGQEARADALGDQIDEARIKARAGKVAEAVEDLDNLAADHPDDPRVHYYRAVFLTDLDRRNDAADAIELAESTMAKYLKDGRNAAEVLGIQADLKKMADVALLYRRQARAIFVDYKAKAMPMARDLVAAGKQAQAQYILEELAAVCDPDDQDLEALRREIAAAEAKGKSKED